MKFSIRGFFLVALVFNPIVLLNAFAEPVLNIHVSIPPQQYFVEKIGKHRVNVNVLVKPGKNPATYSPSPDQMRKLAASDIYFRIGVPFENGILHKIESITTAQVVDTRKGIVLRKMGNHTPDKKDLDHDKEPAGTHTDPHDDETHHSHAGLDPHIWMSPVLVKTQAHTIFQTLSTFDPGGKDDYKANYELFVKELDALDLYLKKTLKAFKGENLFVFHPSFGYFTDAYGLRQVAVETMGKAPKGKVLSNIIKRVKKQKTRVIFVQPQFDRNTAQKIASAIKGTVVSIDPLAFDYLANMERIAHTISAELK